MRYEFVPRWNVGGAFVGGGVHSAFMRIRTLVGPPLPHELVNDTCRAIILSHSAAAVGVKDNGDEPAPAEWEIR